MSFRVQGLHPAEFEHLFGLDDASLAKHKAKRYVTDENGGYPCRITLEDVGAGENLLLVNYAHQPCATAYASQGPIFVREKHATRAEWIDEIPDQLQVRLISLRAYDRNDMMVDADVVDGKDLKPLVERFLANKEVAYLHAHFARRGCFAAKIERT